MAIKGEGKNENAETYQANTRDARETGELWRALLKGFIFNLCLKDDTETALGCPQGDHSTKVEHEGF